MWGRLLRRPRRPLRCPHSPLRQPMTKQHTAINERFDRNEHVLNIIHFYSIKTNVFEPQRTKHYDRNAQKNKLTTINKRMLTSIHQNMLTTTYTTVWLRYTTDFDHHTQKKKKTLSSKAFKTAELDNNHRRIRWCYTQSESTCKN